MEEANKTEQSAEVQRDIEYIDAPEVRKIAQELINTVEDHAHLKKAKLGFLFRVKGTSWKEKGETVMGKAVKVPGREKYYSGLDLLVIINGDIWNDALPLNTKRALVDHELSHFFHDKEKETWSVIGHDVEDFVRVIQRHGLWNKAARVFVEAGSKQLGLFEMREAS